MLSACSLYDSGANRSSQNKAMQGTQAAKTAQVKQRFPDFSIKDINGKNVKLSDYEGKIVFIYFWATWSPYCVQEMPNLDKTAKEISKGNDAVFLTVNSGEKQDIVKKFIADNKLSLTVLTDTQGIVTGNNNIFRLPTTLVINRNGTLYSTLEGKVDQKTLSGIINKLK
jgi:peroxiredoxin